MGDRPQEILLFIFSPCQLPLRPFLVLRSEAPVFQTGGGGTGNNGDRQHTDKGNRIS